MEQSINIITDDGGKLLIQFVVTALSFEKRIFCRSLSINQKIKNCRYTIVCSVQTRTFIKKKYNIYTNIFFAIFFLERIFLSTLLGRYPARRISVSCLVPFGALLDASFK